MNFTDTEAKDTIADRHTPGFARKLGALRNDAPAMNGMHQVALRVWPDALFSLRERMAVAGLTAMLKVALDHEAHVAERMKRVSPPAEETLPDEPTNEGEM